MEGREYLQEGYVEQQVWQEDFNAKVEQAEKLNAELTELVQYLDDESAAKVNDFDASKFKYIKEADSYITDAEKMKQDALAAKKRQLEQQRRTQQAQRTQEQQSHTNGSGLTRSSGVNWYNGRKETYYNLDMSGVVANAKAMGIEGDYWVRDDGVKMYGSYVIVAAQMPKGTIISTSLGSGIVLDWCQAGTIDVATIW